jgi:D-alanine-D-alanine ligase
MTPAQTHVCILYGGTSPERGISLLSGANVAAALATRGYHTTLIDTGERDFVSRLQDCAPDCCFLALHGAGGEDGSIQGLLELLGLPYTGSGILASALSMDKPLAKQIYQANGIPTPQTLDATDLCFPCVYKPVGGGSSVGVSILQDAAELADLKGQMQAPEAAQSALEGGFFEEYIQGTELTVAVIGPDEGHLTALPVIEIRPKHAFYDYASKYDDDGSVHVIPAELSEAESRECARLAIAAHRALGCAQVSRTDIIISRSGSTSGQAFVIETNTIPGMTDVSLLPQTAAVAGIAAPDLYSRFIEWTLGDK